MTSQSETKICLYCAEDIKAAAILCKHCGKEQPSLEVPAATDCWNCGALQALSSGACPACGVELDAETYVERQTVKRNPLKVIALVLAGIFVILVGTYLVVHSLPQSSTVTTTAGTDVEGETQANSAQSSLPPLVGNAADVTWSCMAMPNGDTSNGYCYVQFALENTGSLPITVADAPFVTVDGKIYAVADSSRFKSWASTFNPGAIQQSEFYFVLPLGGNIERISIADPNSPFNPDGVVETSITVALTE